jgi:hypothetical protein
MRLMLQQSLPCSKPERESAINRFKEHGDSFSGCHAKFHGKGLPSQRKPEQFRSKSGQAIKANLAQRRAKNLALNSVRAELSWHMSHPTGFGHKKTVRRLCRRLGIC